MQPGKAGTANHLRSHSQRGVSLVELLVVCAIIAIASAIVVLTIQSSLESGRANDAQQLVLNQLRQARQQALGDRMIYIVTFQAPGTILVQQKSQAGTVQISQTQLPHDIQFLCVNGIPITATTVPDGFGAGVVPIDFKQANGGGGTAVYFYPDGSARDDQGRINDGIVYTARPNDLGSSRAVTLFGTTGRIKGWKLYIGATNNTWQ